jgi:hypothetical protein
MAYLKIEHRKTSRGNPGEIVRFQMVDVPITHPQGTASIYTHRSPSLTLRFYERKDFPVPHLNCRGDIAHPEVLEAMIKLLEAAKNHMLNRGIWSDYEI